MKIEITINIYPKEDIHGENYDSRQMEFPFVKSPKGRPRCKANWHDLKRSLEELGELKLRRSNIGKVCRKLGICERTAYRIWKDCKKRFALN